MTLHPRPNAGQPKAEAAPLRPSPKIRFFSAASAPPSPPILRHHEQLTFFSPDIALERCRKHKKCGVAGLLSAFEGIHYFKAPRKPEFPDFWETL
jgi:hypothetical protein